MAEYFEISFLIEKDRNRIAEIDEMFKMNFNLKQGENYLSNCSFSFLSKKNILLTINENEKSNFIDITISVPDQIFNRDAFEKQIAEYSNFIDKCFALNQEFLYALCSYELNGYLLSQIKDWREIDLAFLSKFPLVHIRNKIVYEGNTLKNSNSLINTAAQDIFI